MTQEMRSSEMLGATNTRTKHHIPEDFLSYIAVLDVLQDVLNRFIHFSSKENR